MRYFRLLDDVEFAGRWHLGEVQDCAGEPQEMWFGRRSPAVLRLRSECIVEGLELDFSLTAFADPVASEKLAEAIQGLAGGAVERIPLEIPGHPGFQVVNVVRTVDCLEEAPSAVEKWSEQDIRPDAAVGYKAVGKVVLDAGRIPVSEHCFRVKGWPIALVISLRMKRVMEECGCVGAFFEALAVASSADSK